MRFQFTLWRLFASILRVGILLGLFRAYCGDYYDRTAFQSMWTVAAMVFFVGIGGFIVRPGTGESAFVLPFGQTFFALWLIDFLCKPEYLIYNSRDSIPLFIVWNAVGSIVGAVAFFVCRWRALGGALIGLGIQFLILCCRPIVQY